MPQITLVPRFLQHSDPLGNVWVQRGIERGSVERRVFRDVRYDCHFKIFGRLPNVVL